MSVGMWVRRATAQDTAHVVEIIRGGFSAWVNERTIYGSPKVDRYIKAAIESVHFAAPQFFVAGEGQRILAVAQVTPAHRNTMLSYICTREASRSLGLGRALLMEVARLDSKEGSFVTLDVFKTNTRAIHWYRSLGFSEESRIAWWELNKSDQEDIYKKTVVAIGLPQADVTHAHFGFSEFTLEVDSASHRIGRLGSKWFRVNDIAAALDRDVVLSLIAMDPTRNVLVQCKLDENLLNLMGSPTLESLRMSVEASLLRTRLNSVESAQ